MNRKKIILTLLLTSPLLSLPAEVSQKTFSKMDRDGDGKFSYEEYVAFRMGSFKNQDKNGDGFIDASEAKNKGFVKRADTDGDGKVSKDEAAGFYKTWAETRVDADKDGFVTLGEINA